MITMIRTQVSLDPDMYREAKAEARRQGVSVAEFVRRALAGALTTERHDKPWMRHAGAVRSGDPKASLSVDAVVYGKGRP